MKIESKLRALLQLAAFACVAAAGLSDTAMAQSVSLTATPSSLTFAGVQANTVSATQTIGITATSTTNVTIQVSQSAPWLIVTPGSLANVGTTAQNLTVKINAQGLTQGTYQGYFTVAVNAQNQITVNVSAAVVGNSVFFANPSSLAYSAQQGATASTPTSTNVRITSSGAALTYSIGGTTQGNLSWLQISNTTGSTGDSGFNVVANPTGLAPGLYLGSITIQSTTTADSLTINVSLTVVGNVTVSVSPAQPAPLLYQIGVVASNSPLLTQQLTVSASGGSTTFSVGVSPPAPWLVVSPLSGTVGATSAILSVTATPFGLQPGVYTTNVTVMPQNGVALTPVPITLIVSNNPLIQLSAGTVNFVAGFGSASPSDQTIVLTGVGSSANVPFTVGSDSSWLTATPTSGTTQSTITIHVNQSGLTVGNYTGRLTVRPSNGDTYSETVLVNLIVSNTTTVTVTPPLLYFSYQTNQGSPAAQTFQVTAPGGGSVPVSVTASTTGCGNWLTASASAGATPVTVTVTANTTGLTTAGACTGSVRVAYDSGIGATSATVPVTLAIGTNAELAISFPAGFGVETVQQGSPSFTRSIPLTSTDPSTQVSFTANAISVGWLFQSSNSAQTPQNLIVTFQPSNLPVGSYSGFVNITSPSLPTAAQTIAIPITLIVTPTVTVTPSATSLAFQQAQGSALPPAQTLTLNATPAGLGPTWAAAVTQVSGGNWLSLSSSSGSANGGGTSVSIAQNSLSPGTYQASIVFTIQGAATSSITVPVTYTIQPAQTVTASVSSLSFNYTTGGSNPPSQSFQITTNNGTAVFSVGVNSATSWLTTDITSGSTPKTVNVSVNAQSLSPGNYSGTVTVASPGVLSTPISIPVSLTVVSPVTPVTGVVTNSASGVTGVISAGEIITIKGTNLGPTTGVTFAAPASGGTVATTLAGVSVLFDSIPGIPIYVSSTQINVVVPWEIDGRLSTNMVVQLNGQASLSTPLRVENSAPGIFTANATGIGQALVVNQNGTLNGNGTNNTTSAAQGSYVQVYLTGGGTTNPPSKTGSISPLTSLQYLNGTAIATVGGVPATVQFAGAAPGWISGLVQMNIQLPKGVTGQSVPISVEINGRTSPTGPTIAIQ